MAAQPRTHTFLAVAFVENFALRELAPQFPGAKLSTFDLQLPKDGEGDVFVYPFGAVVFHDVPAERRELEIARLHKALPRLTTQVRREEFTVREEPGAKIGFANGVLTVDSLTPGRTGTVALTVAQSAAMEYYEGIVERLFDRTLRLVERLEKYGSVPVRTRPLHRFIGEAIGVRSEVLVVLHLLDKPDAAWDDPAMDLIYADLRSEFDLIDRYEALESKLRSVQESLELVLDVARDRRMFVMEAVIVALFVFEIALSLADII